MDDHVDDAVDEQIRTCLDFANPKSFFLFAGAGSGKTRSLQRAVAHLLDTGGHRLSLSGQRIAIITYTNAACDEIKQRLEFHGRVEVSTIHSFAWSLINGRDSDIRDWVARRLTKEIASLEVDQGKGRSNSKAAMDRVRLLEAKRKRLATLTSVPKFVYSPQGDNTGQDSLSHSEVIAMTSEFLTVKPTLQRLLICQYPVLLIDESQDTNKQLMDAFLAVQSAHESRFCLGLFGDTMQRIYADGKVDLGRTLPDSWAKPAKTMNHRCPHRVIRLINRIRKDVDEQLQFGRSDKEEGWARLFVFPERMNDKLAAEEAAANRMAEITDDPGWSAEKRDIKTLTLEHHMAAKRLGFAPMYEALYQIDWLRTGLLNGTVPALSFFSKDILPVVAALRQGDAFELATAVRTRSPILRREALLAAGEDQLLLLKKAKGGCQSLEALFEGREPTFLEVLRDVASTGLFSVPEALLPFAKAEPQITAESNDGALEEVAEANDISAWREALGTPFSQIEPYHEYVVGLSRFNTHQGVKGLEYPRVAVIISDDEARGFMFSYEKLFGTKQLSDTDRRNQSDGIETTLDRTRRLLYVTCSRAKSSLAVILYSGNPDAVKSAAIEREWFEEEEIELLVQ